MIDMKKQYKTRDGKAVKVLMTDLHNYQPVVAVITYRDGTDGVYTFSSDGHFLSDNPNHDNDLIEVKPVREGWVNVYKWNGVYRPFRFSGEALDQGIAYHTKEEADRASEKSSEQRLACIKITFTEGEGL